MVMHKVITWNVNGLNNKRGELEAFMAVHKPAIMALNDTRLDPSTRLCVAGYMVHRTDGRPGTAGGAAVLVRNDIPSRRVDPIIADGVGYSTVTVSVRMKHRYTLTCVYRRPRSGLAYIRALLASIQTNRYHMLLGDLNATHTDWNCSRVNELGRHLQRTAFTVIHPGVHTFRHSGGGWVSTLDLLLTTSPHHITGCAALDFGPSDHRPVLYELHGDLPPAPPPRNYMFSKADWEGYKDDVLRGTPNVAPLLRNEEIDAAVATLTGLITEAADRRIPKFSAKPNRLRTPPAHILQLVQQRNRLRNLHHRTGNSTLKPAINAMKRQIETLMSQWKTSLWNEQLLRTHGDHRQFWRLIRTSHTKRRGVRLHSGDELLTPVEQAETMAGRLREMDVARESFAVPIQPTEHPEPQPARIFSSYRELESILRRTKGGKAPGADGISGVLLKMLPRKTKAYLLNIYNSCTRIGYFPSCWKHAVVVPILKPKRKGDKVEDYRPISLLSHMGKVYERLLLKHVLSHCTEHCVIPDEQTGFRKRLSCDHHLAKLQSHVTEELRRNRATSFVSLDCTQAFDCVNHRILVQRLREYAFPAPLVKIIETYLTGRTFTVRVEDKLSTTQAVVCGVPQGSVLGPVLYTIYTAHIVRKKRTKAIVAAFADDIGVYATSHNAKKSMQTAELACSEIVEELEEVGIRVNPSKTDALVMSFQGAKGGRPKGGLPKTFTISGASQPVSTRVNYLGIILDRHLSFAPHVRHRMKMARERTYKMHHLLLTSSLSLRLKLQIYKAVIRPSLLHGAPLLHHISPNTRRILQQRQNGIIRKIVWHSGLRRMKAAALHEEFALPLVDEYISRRHVKFFDGLRNCPNPLFSDLVPAPRPCRWQDL